MNKAEQVLREVKWLGIKATMRTIKPRTVVNKVSFLQAKLEVNEIETQLQEKNG